MTATPTEHLVLDDRPAEELPPDPWASSTPAGVPHDIPGPVGGMALLTGVLLAGPSGAAAAVRLPDGTITTRTFDRVEPSRLRSKVAAVGGLRAFAALGSMRQGLEAMRWSLATVDEKAGFVLSAPFAVVGAFVVAVFTALFAVAPLLAARALVGNDPLAATLVEGLLRGGILVGYLLLIGRNRQTTDLFAYHGAEHQSVAAFEAGAAWEPAAVAPFPTAHVRCGTNLLATVLIVATALTVPVALAPPALALALRPLCLVLGLAAAYELIAACATRMDRTVCRFTMAPGLALQRLTTRTPSPAQIEVALAALAAIPVPESPTEPTTDDQEMAR